jgi:hypothetical protein
MSLLLIGAHGRLKGLLPYGVDQEQALEKNPQHPSLKNRNNRCRGSAG